MADQSIILLFHLALLTIQVICLSSLVTPYVDALKEQRWNAYLLSASYTFIRFFFDSFACVVFASHLFFWSIEPNGPQEYTLPTIGIVCGWTAMLAMWTKYRQKISKSEGKVK
ncbi:hypothetical protein [Rhodoferax sp. GW822-FHT02A01]|uniref:hypothetical protein n=1 Tax=Rhodoferax sp. GW822-FHT02A01 TaxID=3141537 RepID=UPI00315C913A